MATSSWLRSNPMQSYCGRSYSEYEVVFPDAVFLIMLRPVVFGVRRCVVQCGLLKMPRPVVLCARLRLARYGVFQMPRPIVLNVRRLVTHSGLFANAVSGHTRRTTSCGPNRSFWSAAAGHTLRTTSCSVMRYLRMPRPVVLVVRRRETRCGILQIPWPVVVL